MKKLIAAAVAAAVVAPLTAMADGPVLYGKIHTSVENHDNNGTGAGNYDEWSLQSRDSRIGVKGSEDLGNGMKVGYLIEWEVDMDGNAGDLGERNRAITLSGDWGTVAMGKWDTPMKTLGRKVDLFGDQIGDLRNIGNGAGDIVDLRLPNVVAYFTPNMNGFSATVAYSFDHNGHTGAGEQSDDNSDDAAWSMNAMYENGPLFLGVGYTDADKTIANSGNPLLDDAKTWRVAGSYAFGDFKILGSWTDTESSGFNKDADTEVWHLGASYTMGNNTIKVQYADRDETSSNADDDADMWAVGIDHMMSQRTTVYAAYATADNGTNQDVMAYGQGQSGNANGVAGEDSDAFAVGIIHKF